MPAVARSEDRVGFFHKQRVTFGLLALACLAMPARAQAPYPTRAITLVVPFAAGGTVDMVGTIIGQRMARSLGQPIIFENVVGAGGTTATTRVKRAAPDGYTIIIGHMGTHGASSALYPALAYDPVGDFEPIGMIASTSVLVVARRDIGSGNLADFLDYARAQQGNLTMAHAGVGSISHIACQMFNALVNLDPKVVAFQGTAPALTALGNGKLDYMCDQSVSVVPQVRAGRIKPLLVAGSRHLPALPDVPTSKEVELDRFQLRGWMALFAPKNTPAPIAQKLVAALNEALDDPDVRKKLGDDIGSDIATGPQRGPDALHKVVTAEVAKWSDVFHH